MIANIVYTLCALACGLCAILLLKTYLARRSRLLLWSALAFCVFGLGNIVLCLELPGLLESDLRIVRHGIILLGIGLLLRGLIWEGMK